LVAKTIDIARSDLVGMLGLIVHMNEARRQEIPCRLALWMARDGTSP